MKADGFSIVNRTRGKIPRDSVIKTLSDIKRSVLGESYELSVALLPPRDMRKASVESGHGDTPANVLSFPFSKTSGEILLCPATIRAQAKTYEKTPQAFLVYLFIHGLHHLKGFDHGEAMEKEEKRVLSKFGY